ncbi:MAG TPA: hypothetical protein VG963_00340 [Polyangiaceae bacterium]|nr:hypothetical protein [Polyangiaceae bacterium]
MIAPVDELRRAPGIQFISLSLTLCLGACDHFASLGTLPPKDAQAAPGANEESADGSVMSNTGDAAVPTTSIDECGPGNAAGLQGATLAAARAGGSVAADARILYPYDSTLFPARIAAPLLMWTGPSTDAIYLRARAAGLVYEGCVLPSGDHELAIPSTLWFEAQRAAQRNGDPLALDLELTTLMGGTASGPLRVSLTLSADAFSGVLYYMSYGSVLAGPINLAAVMRLPLGGAPEPLLSPQGGCAGCHSVSANGTALIASITGLGNWYDDPGAAQRDPAPKGSNVMGGEFAAIDPTGTFYLAPAHPPLFGPRTMGASPQLTATLFDLASGAPISDTGIPDAATTPAFSPDGKWLAFNDGSAGGHTLALMAFSGAQRQASSYRVIASDSALYPAWPTFRPGSEQVVFALGASASFGADGALLSPGLGPPGPNSDLYSAELDGSGSALLFRAMGFLSPQDADAERTYLPFAAEDLHQNYDPNILPTRAGAHDWLFFDSVRHYGNRGVVRGLWCAALDTRPTKGTDPSHPPFYLPGQEDGAASLRPIAARGDADLGR